MKNNLILRKNFTVFFIFLLGLTQLNAQSIFFNWARGFSGSNWGFNYNIGFGIAVGVSGNVYSTGSFEKTNDFNPSSGIYTLTAEGLSDIFISKLDGSGNFVWAKSMGGPSSTGNEKGYAIAVDDSDNIYTVGNYFGTVDFDPGPGIFNLSSASGRGLFISKLNDSGNLVWAKSLGGSYYNEATSVAIDVFGKICITGNFSGSVDFDPGVSIFNITATGLNDFFILKLDAAGNFVWAKSMGGISSDAAFDLAVDPLGNIYTTGVFSGTVDFDPSAGTFNLIAATGSYFVSKLDTAGNFVWARNFGGAAPCLSKSITVDAAGNVFAAGCFTGTADFDPGTGIFNLIAVGTTSLSQDAFILKLNTTGDFIWAKSMGGALWIESSSIALDPLNNVYTSGIFNGTVDFDPGTGTYDLTAAGGPNFFISKLDAAGNFVWAKGVDGNLTESYARDIVLDATGNVYTTGQFEGTVDFDPDSGVFNLNAQAQDIFVLKMSTTPLGINENKGVKNIRIYPNPTSGQLNITLGNISDLTSIKIINAIGQLVIEKIIENNNNLNIDLSKQPTGIYFVEIKQTDNIMRTKLIKQ